MKPTAIAGLSLAVSLAAIGTAHAARDHISIVGSSTVYPFATVVAETFGKSTEYKTPTIESTGSGGGLKLFCKGVGTEHPDITNASRRIKKSEIDKCAANGVADIIEVKVGYDGIVMASSKKAEPMALTRRDIFLALAKEIPDPNGGSKMVIEKLVPNPHTHWNQVNPDLPNVKIEVLGPPPTSGTRDAFAELALEGGCKTIPWIKAMKKKDKKHYKAVCHTVREDGGYVEAGENDNLIVQKLKANPAAVGVFGFSFLEENADVVQGNTIDGVAPEFETIADGSYPVSRPLYFYVKKAHIGVIPGIDGYLAEFTSDRAWGDEGYLTDRGLIPMPEDERARFAADAKDQNPMSGL